MGVAERHHPKFDSRSEKNMSFGNVNHLSIIAI